MGRRRTPILLPQQQANEVPNESLGPHLSTREYYNQRYNRVEKTHKSITCYADDTKSAIARMERLWRE